MVISITSVIIISNFIGQILLESFCRLLSIVRQQHESDLKYSNIHFLAYDHFARFYYINIKYDILPDLITNFVSLFSFVKINKQLSQIPIRKMHVMYTILNLIMRLFASCIYTAVKSLRILAHHVIAFN